MADSTLEVVFELNSKLDGINQAIAKVERAKKSSSGLSKGLGNLSRNFARASGVIARGGAVAGGALFGAGAIFSKQSFETFAEYESSIKGIEAVLKPTTRELEALEKETKRLGRTTKFTAREAAAGTEVLAKNGVKTKDILDGVLESSLNLAASTGAELPASADVLTDVLQVFQLEAKDTAEAVDSINSVIVNSKFGFEDYAAALAAGGPSASAVNQTFDEFNATIAATASFFTSGETAGTAYKVFIDRMIPRSDAAAIAMKKLGLNLFEANGEMKAISNIAGQLDRGLEGLTEQERIEALNALFGTRGKNFAVALARVGEEGVKTTEFLRQFVSSSDQAKKRLEGTQGEILKLKSAFEGVQITFGEPIANRLTPVIQEITGSMSQLSAEGTQAASIVDTVINGTINVAEGATAAWNAARFGVTSVALAATKFIGVLLKVRSTTLGLGVSGLEVIGDVTAQALKLGNTITSSIIAPYNKLLKKLGKKPVQIAQIDEDLGVKQIEKITNKLKGAQAKVDQFKKATAEAEVSLNNQLAGIQQDLNSNGSIRDKYNELQASAALVRQASAELRDEEVLFLDLQKSLQEATTEKAPAQELETIRKLITAQSEIVEKRKETLNELEGTTNETKALNDSTVDSTGEVRASIEQLAEASGVSMDEAISAFARLEKSGSSHLDGLNGKLDELKTKLSTVTDAGNKFEDAAVRNSWLKDFALMGIEFLQSLSNDGFGAIENDLSTITKTGEKASNLAINQKLPVNGVQQQEAARRAVANTEGGEETEEVGGILSQLTSEIPSVDEQLQGLASGSLNDVSAGIEGLVTGSANWGDSFLKAGQNVLSTLIKIGVQRTAMFLLGQTQQKASTASQVASGALIAKAQAPGALLTSISSFGSASILGTAAAVAGLAAIAGAVSGAFNEGGVIPGGVSGRDNRLALVASGERVIRNGPSQEFAGLLDGINAGGNPIDLLNIPRQQESFSAGSIPDVTVEQAQTSSSAQEVNISMLFDQGEFMDRMEGVIDDRVVRAFSDNKSQFL